MADQQIEEKPELEQQPEEQEQPGRLQVDLSEDDSDDEGDAPEPKKTRRQRMRELRETLKSERSEREKMQRELAELRGQMQGYQQSYREPPQRQETPSDPFAAQLKANRERQQGVLAKLANPNLRPEEQERLQEQYYEIDNERQEIVTQRALLKNGGAREQGLSRMDLERQMLETQYPEVYTNPVRMAEAAAEAARLVHELRKPANFATAQEAARNVSERYKTRIPKPSDSDKAKYTSVPGRAGVNGASTTFVPNKLQLSAARAYTQHLPDLSDAERVRRWMKGPGKKLKIQ